MSQPDAQQPQSLPEETFAKMVDGAISANTGTEARLDALLKHMAGSSNGKGSSLIIGPEGRSAAQLNVPSAQALCAEILNATRIALQTARITLVALNDMDTRLRQSQAPPEKVGDERGSQSPVPTPIEPSERRPVAGVKTATNGP